VERKRPFIVTILALLPAAPIIAGIAIVSGEGSSGTIALPPVTTANIAPPKPPAPPPPQWPLVAHLQKATELLATPGGKPLGRLGLRTVFGSEQYLLVARQSGPWLGVLSNVAGNGRIGWIPASSSTLSQVTYELDVSIHEHLVTVKDKNVVVGRFTAAVGAPASPTPTGHFAVTDRIKTGDPSGSYGCCILATTAVSPHPIENWGGGNRVAIHSTPEVSSLGHSVSHGCVRVSLKNGRFLLAHVPLGTPTVITG
jgi:lipoprotein-anchoring transpeptidase ErfK/SrfK